MRKLHLLLLMLALTVAVFILVLPVSAEQIEGKYNDNVSWVLDTETGTLTILNDGAMEYDEFPEWFGNLNEIKNVIIEDGVTKIHRNAFYGLKYMESISIPDTVTSIGDQAFSGCFSLIRINLPDSVKNIGDYAFSSCRNLTEFVFPKDVRKVSWGMLGGCIRLKSVTLNEKISKIEYYAFDSCTDLTEISLPDSVRTIEGYAFRHCKSLRSVEFGRGIQSIGDGAFSDCVSLIRISIPGSVTEIGANAFYNCAKLKYIDLPQGLTELNFRLFYSATSLTEITIPSTVTKIDDWVFEWCRELEHIYFLGDAPQFSDYTFEYAKVTVHYSRDNSTWSAQVFQSYGGDVTWVPYDTACGHNTEVADEGYAATCGQTGLTDGTHCYDCGAVLVEQKTIPATGEHTYGDWVEVTAPAVGAPGSEERTCGVCGHIEKNALDPLESLPTEPDVTESTSGNTEPMIPENTMPPTDPVQGQDGDGVDWILPTVCIVLAAVAAGVGLVVLKKKRK